MRNFANKFLLVIALVLVLGCQFTLGVAPVSYHIYAAEEAEQSATITQLNAPSYLYESLNANKPSDTEESVYEALGIKTYNSYLQALSATQKLNDVVIAVVDSGLDQTQPVFANRVLSDYAMDFSTGLPTATDNKWNVDENGHGTHVAGIIADTTLSNISILPIRIFYGTNNDTGNFSFVNAIRYLCALKNGEKVSLVDNDGKETKDYETPLYYNLDKVKVANIVAVNLSVGSDGFNTYDTKAMEEFKTQKYGYNKKRVHYMGYQDVIDNLLKNDILPIVAAGNRSATQSTQIPYYSLPGACDGVLAVSAYDNTETSYKLASFSYYNSNVSLAAPGTDIWSACSSVLSNKTKWSSKLPKQEGDYLYYEDAKILKDADGNFYYRSSGTSMATPFVTACYAMLMSDSSKTQAADYGITYDPNTENDAKFQNIVHKALLSAAATDGVHTQSGYSQEVGYGTVNVSGFVPTGEPATVQAMNQITYQLFVNTTAQNASWGAVETGNDVATSTDWFMACVVLAAAIILIWLIKMFKDYTVSILRKKEKTNDDDEQQ